MMAVSKFFTVCLVLVFLAILRLHCFLEDLNRKQSVSAMSSGRFSSNMQFDNRSCLMEVWRRYRRLCPRMARRGTEGKPVWKVLWLLLVCGDVESNPGPVRFPCGCCGKAVKVNQDGVLCDGCGKWLHRKCIYMDRKVYLQLGESDEPWYCAGCSLPAFSDSYFEDTLGSAFSTGSVTEETEVWSFSNTRKLVIAHLNVRSLLPKLDEIRTCLAGRAPPPIVAFTESWLDETVSDGEICIPGYKAYRKDRNRNGGGVVV